MTTSGGKYTHFLGTVSFGTPDKLFSVSVPAQPTLADVNANGKLDLLYGAVGVFMMRLGQGDGTFQNELPREGSKFLGQPKSIATGDFDKDGKVDAVVTYSDKNGSGDPARIEVFRGSGKWTFQNPTVIKVPGWKTSKTGSRTSSRAATAPRTSAPSF